MLVLNVLIVIFLLFFAYWWASQGLFSSLIHLVCTILAAVVALGLWEPVSLTMVDAMPEFAWAIGLLAPFGVSLIVLRLIMDKAVPGNLSFHNLADRGVGGALGVVSGVITTGLLLIGLQFTPAPEGFTPKTYTLDASGEVTKDSSLWIGVDAMATGMLNYVADGPMAGILASQTWTDVHPNLAAEAAFYTQSAYPQSRRAVRPNNVKFIEGSAYYAVSGGVEGLEGGSDGKTVVLGVETVLQPESGEGAGDEDAAYRVTRSQIALLAKDTFGSMEVFPSGYIQRGEYKSMTTEADFAYSRTSVPLTRHHWVFHLKEGQEPVALRVKQVRLDLPEPPEESAAAVADLLGFSQPARTASAGDGGGDRPDQSNLGDRRGRNTGTTGQFAEVNDKLVVAFNRNQMTAQGVELEGDAILRGRATLAIPKGMGVSGPLAVEKIFHNTSSNIVQVSLGRREAGSLLGKAMQMAAAATQAPVVVDDGGLPYQAIGWSAETPRTQLRFSFDPQQRIRAMSQLPLNNIQDNEELKLYFLVPTNTRLVEFRMGNAQSQSMDLYVQ